jgi:hypothetical protein
LPLPNRSGLRLAPPRFRIDKKEKLLPLIFIYENKYVFRLVFKIFKPAD